MEVYCPWLLLFILCGLSTGTFPSSAPTNHLFKPSLSTFSSQASQLFQTRCLPVVCPHTVSTCIHAKASYSVVPSAHCLQVSYSSGVNFTPKPGSSLGSALSLFWSELVDTQSVCGVCMYVCGVWGGRVAQEISAQPKRQLPSVLLCGDPTLQAEVDLGRGWLSGNHACKKHHLHSWEKTACS